MRRRRAAVKQSASHCDASGSLVLALCSTGLLP